MYLYYFAQIISHFEIVDIGMSLTRKTVFNFYPNNVQSMNSILKDL